MAKTSYSFKLQARPGELLIDHLMGTANGCKEKAGEGPPPRLIRKECWLDIAYLIGLGHDLGKGTSFFQKRLQDPSYSKMETYHSELSALITADLISKYTCLQGMTKTEQQRWSVLAYLVVRQHHRNIGNAQDELEASGDKEILEKQLEALDVSEILEIINQNAPITYAFNPKIILKMKMHGGWVWLYKQLGIQLYYLHKLLFSILVSSDKGSVILDQDHLKSLIKMKALSSDAVERMVQSKPGEEMLDKMRHQLYREAVCNIDKMVSHRVLSLNLPTGTGKTFTSLAVATRIREVADKSGPIVYCLPFTSVIDQNYTEFEKVIKKYQGNKSPTSNQLLKHHYLAPNEYQDGDKHWSADESQYLLETWESDLVVTTFVQFFETLAGSGNRQLLKLYRLRDAVVILDEIQAVPVKYWDFIRSLLVGFTEEFNCHIVLATATLPLIFTDTEALNVVPNPQGYFQKLGRTKLKLSHKRTITLTEFYPIVDDLISTNVQKDVLIVLNTIGCAEKVYEHLKQKGYGREYIYLSTYVIPKERGLRISGLKEKSVKPRLIVTTQLVEAGVDLDVGLVIRDFGPLDSINQVAGRCNRHFRRETEEVWIFHLKEEGRRDFAAMVYDSALLAATTDALGTEEEISEAEYWQVNQRYFQKVKLKRLEADKELIACAEALEHCTLSRKFQLIEEQPKQPVFVQVDDDAKDLWQRYVEIQQNLGGWERKVAWHEIKREFLEYVINVSTIELPELPMLEGVALLAEDNLNRYYVPETGFIKGVKSDD